jgi:predicted adenylyl cyclase CyaB
MSLEIEAKFKVDSHEPVRERLRAARAAFIERGLEVNQLFDRPDGSLRRRGHGLRIRSFDVEGGPTRATLTVKGPRLSGPLKKREEAEIEFTDAEVGVRVLELLGFVRVLRYEKRRESWRLSRCRIELDEPPHLGLYVEIEGPDEKSIVRVQRQLDLVHAEHVPSSYVTMLADYCDSHDIAERILRLSSDNS